LVYLYTQIHVNHSIYSDVWGCIVVGFVVIAGKIKMFAIFKLLN
jgi:hypothetical protein